MQIFTCTKCGATSSIKPPCNCKAPITVDVAATAKGTSKVK